MLPKQLKLSENRTVLLLLHSGEDQAEFIIQNENRKVILHRKLPKKLTKLGKKYPPIINEEGRVQIGNFAYNEEKDIWERIAGILQTILKLLPFLKSLFTIK